MKTDELIPNVDVPEGVSGNWKVERFTIEPSDPSLFLFNLRAGRRGVRPGYYTRLMRGSTVVMSDTDAEKSDHREAVRRATGTILLNGLGLGMVLNACLLKPEVQHAFVVEKSEGVIKLCAAHYQQKFGDRLTIIHDDALTFKPPKVRFGIVWHDIWDYICADNLDEMATLHRRYGRRTDWQGSWGKYESQHGR